MNKNKIIFGLVYPFIFLISKLPLRLLYLFSDLAYYVVYYIIGYRKEVVKKNLKLSFPHKSAKELLTIEKKSYRHFTDIFIEMLKGFGLSKKEITKRYLYKNPEVLTELEKLNKSVILLGSHHGNWEWLFNVNAHTSLKCYGAYKKVKNPYFDRYVKTNRGRFGCSIVQTKETIPEIIKNYRKGIPSIYGLLSDQSPHITKTHYWAPFFKQIVPIHTGAEMLAKRFNFPVIYMHVEMPKRGYYEVTFEILATEHLKEQEGYPLTDIYLKKLEQDISKKPEIYFWTHNRFKYIGKAPKQTEKIIIKEN